MHTFKSLQNDLAEAGIRPDDTLIVHSAMRKIGPVDGGAETVLDAFIDFFREKGLVVFPTLTYTLAHAYKPESQRCISCMQNNTKPNYCQAREWGERRREFHVNTTPSCVGLLTNLFMQRPNVYRSLHPTHSVAATGKEAFDFISGHEKSLTPCGKLTPWWKLYERSAKILHLGSEVHNTTFMHGVSEWGREPGNLPGLLEVQVDVYDWNENFVPLPELHNICGTSAYFPRMEEEFVRIGALTRHKIGDADAILMDCRMVADSTLVKLRENPNIFKH